jgi:hypothetical protein
MKFEVNSAVLYTCRVLFKPTHMFKLILFSTRTVYDILVLFFSYLFLFDSQEK